MKSSTKQDVLFRDLGRIEYQAAWDLQEKLLQQNVAVKAERRNRMAEAVNGDPDSYRESMVNREPGIGTESVSIDNELSTTNYLLFVEHPPVYTLGKSGAIEHVLISEEERTEKGISFYHTNRGGDITFHGIEQLVGYPIIDLERFYTDIGKYLRNLEEVIILTMADYGLKGERSPGETGVWMDAFVPGKERKICAMGIRCSRWVTMHGFAFNINNDLSYFDYIIPCGIQNKKVTSLKQELGHAVDMNELKERVKKHFEQVFEVDLIAGTELLVPGV
jgi:lipoyl(octanoyl) transferase